MDATNAFVTVIQMAVPALFAWQFWKSERQCRRYEEMLERHHRMYLESIAKAQGIPVVENETADELFTRMIRIGKWRRGEVNADEGVDNP
jgi:2-phosphoglycerate kinase